MLAQHPLRVTTLATCTRRLAYRPHCAQAMIGDMVAARGGKVHGMDFRYCIDNGAMIAQAGILEYQFGQTTSLADSWVTQRFRTDEVSVVWRKPN